MALTDILAKIQKEYANKAAQLKKDFDLKKKNLLTEFEEKQKEVDENLHNKVEENSKKIIEKTERLAEMEKKNSLLNTKRELIQNILSKSVKKLSESKDYEDYLVNLLKAIPNNEEKTIIIPAKNKEDVTKSAIKKSGKSYFLSDKSGDFQGGFILIGSNFEIDNTFETIINSQLREDLEMELHKIIF